MPTYSLGAGCFLAFLLNLFVIQSPAMWASKMSVPGLLLAVVFSLAVPPGTFGSGGLTVTMASSDLEAARDGEITLPCTYTSTVPDRTNLYISWAKEEDKSDKMVIVYLGKQTSVSDEYFVGRVSFAGDYLVNNAGIKITKLRNEDNGVYKCSVTNMPGTDNGHINLIVLVAPTKPVFSLEGKAEFYHDVKLVCRCDEGSPPPSFSWRRLDANGISVALPVGSVDDPAAGTLLLKNLTLQSSGTYECTAKNKVGTVVTNGTLSVTYPQTNAMMYGIIIGAGLLGFLILTGIIIYCVRRRNRKRREEEGYYSDGEYEMEGQEDRDEKRDRGHAADRDVPREKYLAVPRVTKDDERSERGGARRYRNDDDDYSDSESRRGNGDTGQRRNRRYSDDSDDESRGRQSRQRHDRDGGDYDRDRPHSRSRDRGLDDDRDRPHYRSRDRGLDDDRDRPQSRSRDRGLDDDRDRPHYRSRDRGLDDDRDRPHYRSRDRGLDDDRPRSRSRDLDYDDRDRPYSRSRDRGLDRDDGEGSEYRGGGGGGERWRDNGGGGGYDDSHSETASSVARDTRPRPPPNKPKIILGNADATADV
ncbi:uncharacterized protein LOC144943037 [Lampetra fluviatilis]